jgi:hypothetical protein
MKYNKKYSRIYVSPLFEQKIKERAVSEGVSIIDLTEQVSRDDFDEFLCSIKPKRKKINGSLNGFI